MNRTDLDFFKNTFLFADIGDDEAISAYSKLNPTFRTFEKGEFIYTEHEYERKLGFIADGCCEVQRVHSDGTTLPLNTLKTYGSFGIIAVLSDNHEYVSCIVAKQKSTIVFIDRDDLISIMKNHSSIAINVSKFLANRIIFLNQKVHTFSGTTVEKKLANHLVSCANIYGELEFDFNRKRTSEIINAGRASLYRALDSLRDGKFITYDSKKIYITDLKGLERMSQ